VKRWRLTTETGSVYLLEERGVKDWWFTSARNVVTDVSQDIGAQWWPLTITTIAPRLGEQFVALSRYFEQKKHPERMPGGGKFTSPLRSIERCT
jgi:hypothetical protein